MKLTRTEAIEHLSDLVEVCVGQDIKLTEVDIAALKYAISSLQADEAYNLLYERIDFFTKKEVITMLEDLDLQIDEEGSFDRRVAKVQRLIRDKVKELRGE